MESLYRHQTPNFSVVRTMLGIGHFALIRTYSKNARQGRTTQEFGVFCCLLTATALGRVTTSCADQRANWGEMRKYGKKGGEVSTLALKGWRVYVAPK